MRDVPDNSKKKEIITRWLKGEYKEQISTEMGLSGTQVISTINEWKRELGSAIAEAYRGVANSGIVAQEAVNATDIVQAFKLILVLKKLGVEPQKFDDFAGRFTKMAISSGVEPEGLASILNQVLGLAEIDGIEIHELPAHLESLQTAKRELEAEIEKLKGKKDIIAQTVPGDEYSDQLLDKQNLSQVISMTQQIKQFGLSMDDVSAFAGMVDKAKKYGYDFASIVDFVSSLASVEQEKNRIDSEVSKLRELNNSEQARQDSIQEQLSKHQEMLDSFEKLSETGFESKDFELLNELIRKTAEASGLDDLAIAKQRFFEDIQSLFQSRSASASDPQSVPQGQQAEPEKYSDQFLDMMGRLTSKGITEQTLMKSLIIQEVFKLDLDTLADDLKKYSTIKNAAKRTEDRRVKLESEELELKHKILALEERLHQTTLNANAAFDSGPLSQEPLMAEYDLTPLLRAIKGEKSEINPIDLNNAILRAIDLVSGAVDPQSLTRKILDHAKLSLQHGAGLQQNSL